MPTHQNTGRNWDALNSNVGDIGSCGSKKPVFISLMDVGQNSIVFGFSK